MMSSSTHPVQRRVLVCHRPALDRGQSSDNLTSAAAPTTAAASGTKRSAVSRKDSRGAPPSNVQEELRRLCNPDISFTDDNRVSECRPASGRRDFAEDFACYALVQQLTCCHVCCDRTYCVTGHIVMCVVIGHRRVLCDMNVG